MKLQLATEKSHFSLILLVILYVHHATISTTTCHLALTLPTVSRLRTISLLLEIKTTAATQMKSIRSEHTMVDASC